MVSSAPPAASLIIDGACVEGLGDGFDLIDKFSLAPAGTIRLPNEAQIRAAVDTAHRAFKHGAPNQAARGAILDRAADLVTGDSEHLILLVQQDTGFTTADARGELDRCIQTLRLSATEARTLTGEMVPLEGAAGQAGRLGFTIRVPLGVVAAITPFNAPLNTLTHKFAPAFAAGNAVIIKPSSHTPRTAFRLAELLIQAGVPPGFLSLLYGEAAVVETLLAQPEVRYIAFTGSTEVGRILQRQAGLRRTQMELGSIAFTILCADADLDRALPKIIGAAYRKAGQVCTSIQMLLVQNTIAAEVTTRLTQLVQALPYGDPMLPETVVGPVITEASAIRIEHWIDQALQSGATRLAGGPRAGAVIPPTLLTNINETMRLGCEEIFGPVMSIVPFVTLEDAITRINATPYGLAAGIFTNRLDQAFRAARELEVGGVHINETSSARVDMMPYGGSKQSGFGREGPHYAIREMTEERMVTISGLQ